MKWKFSSIGFIPWDSATPTNIAVLKPPTAISFPIKISLVS